MAIKSDAHESEIMLEIYKQRHGQVQHLQQMRATYFNLYIAVVGISVSSIFGIYGNLERIPLEITLFIGGLIYIVSLLSIMRAERWGGHIIHDLRAIRKIQNYYSSKHKVVADVIPFNAKPLSSLEFDRPLWDRNRSIETPTMMLGAILGALLIGYFAPLNYSWIITGLMVVLAILVWRAEISNLLKRHAKCCISLSEHESQTNERMMKNSSIK